MWGGTLGGSGGVLAGVEGGSVAVAPEALAGSVGERERGMRREGEGESQTEREVKRHDEKEGERERERNRVSWYAEKGQQEIQNGEEDMCIGPRKKSLVFIYVLQRKEG